jgi:MFS family permease
LVIVANAVVWFAFAAAVPVLTLLAVAGTPESEWSDRIARLNEFQGVGWALGLLVGFVVVTAGTAVADVIAAQRAFFLVCAVAASLGFAIAYRTLPADPVPDEVPSMRLVRRRLRPGARFNVRGSAFPFTPTRFYARRLHPRLFAERFTASLGIYFVAVFLFFAGFDTFFAPLPAYLTETGYGSGEVFALYFVLNAGAAVFFRVAAGLVSRHEVALLHAGGLLVRGAALPAVALIGALLGDAVLGFGVASAVFVVIGLTWAVIAVAAGTLVTRLAPAGVRGEAFGVYSALSVLAGGIGGMVGGWLGASSYPLAFAVAGGLVVVGAGVVLALWTSADTASAAGPESS